MLAALALAAPSLPASAAAMTHPRVAPEEYRNLAHVFDGKVASSASRPEARRFTSVERIANYLDDKRLAPGSVLVDTFSPCAPFLVLRSARPRQFVITNDRDFQRVLADPQLFGVKFVLVPPTGGPGAMDALNRAYPDLYRSGAGFTRLERGLHGPGCPAYRLYRVTGTPGLV